MKYQGMTQVQSQRNRDRGALGALRKALQRGVHKQPKRYVPGMEIEYIRVGLTPRVDCFIPGYGLNKEQVEQEYMAWCSDGHELKQIEPIHKFGPALNKSVRRQQRGLAKALGRYKHLMVKYEAGIGDRPRRPTIQRHFVGVEVILQGAGLEPNVDVFVPRPDEDPRKAIERRKKWSNRFKYKLRREANGESYRSHEQRKRDRFNEEHGDEWERLLKRMESVTTGTVQNLDTKREQTAQEIVSSLLGK